MGIVGFPMPDPDDLQLSDMTADEQRGFRRACQTIALWAAQIEGSAKSLAGHNQTIPLDEHIKTSARTARGLAEALELTLGP